MKTKMKVHIARRQRLAGGGRRIIEVREGKQFEGQEHELDLAEVNESATGNSQAWVMHLNYDDLPGLIRVFTKLHRERKDER